MVSRGFRLAFAFAAIVLAGASGAFASPSREPSAGEPRRVSVTQAEVVTVTACGYPVEVRVSLEHELQYHDDREGEQWMGMHRVHGTITFTNLDTGYTLVARDASIARAYDFVRDVDENGNGTVSWTRSNQGLNLPLVVPGEGMVFADVGRLTFRITVPVVNWVVGRRTTVLLTEAGQWSGWRLSDICPYLAPSA